MHKITLLFIAALFSFVSLKAQTVATFDDLTLTALDTYYVNLSASGTDVGFNSGLAHFPCIYDTTGGFTTWNYFAYSNKTDSITSGYTNQYAAKTGIGYAGSSKYAVAYCSNPTTFANEMQVKLIGAAIGKPVDGFFVTNSTYAYNSMKNGDAFARKFHDGDWFLLTIKGYIGGLITTDSVNFYLANFLFSDSSMNYIVKTWQWVNLLPLGHVDSLQFQLHSSDNGSFGMNTPAYFCIDNFTTNETVVNVNEITASNEINIYPNPVKDVLHLDFNQLYIQKISIFNVIGKFIKSFPVYNNNFEMNTSYLAPGTYFLRLTGENAPQFIKFIKE